MLFSTVAIAEPRTLEEAWIAAYKSNPTLAAARAKLRATDEQVSQALSNWRPSIDAISNIGRLEQSRPNQAFFGNSDFVGTSRGYGVQFKQPLFRGFRTKAQTEAAEKQVLAARAQLEVAEQQLFVDTATAFLDLVRDLAIVQINRDNETVLRKKSEEVQIRSTLGDLTQTDVHQAQSRLARTRVNRFQAENAMKADVARFKRLTGEEAAQHFEEPSLTLETPHDLDDAVKQAGTHNPNVVAALHQVEEASAEIGFFKGALLPELNLQFNATRNWGESSTLPGLDDTKQVQLQLTVPLFRGGTDYSRTRAAIDTVSERAGDLQEARHRAQESVSTAWEALLTAQASLAADHDEIDSASLALNGVREESRVGTRTTLDVLNAEQELLDAETELAKAKHDAALAIVQIKAAVGQLTAEALHLPIKTYDPHLHYDEVRNKWIGWHADSSDDPSSTDKRATPP